MNLEKVAFVVRVETTTLLTLTTAWGNSMADFKAMAIPPLDDRGTSCEANTNQTSGLWQEVSTLDFRWLDSTKVLYLIRFSAWVMADWDGTLIPHLRLALGNTIVHGTATTTSEGVVERDMSAVWGEKEKDFFSTQTAPKTTLIFDGEEYARHMTIRSGRNHLSMYIFYVLTGAKGHPDAFDLTT